jgi:hypothetical protein
LDEQENKYWYVHKPAIEEFSGSFPLTVEEIMEIIHKNDEGVDLIYVFRPDSPPEKIISATNWEAIPEIRKADLYDYIIRSASGGKDFLWFDCTTSDASNCEPAVLIPEHNPVQLQVIDKGLTLEPTLDQAIYQEILQVIYDTGVVFERNPSIYKGKGEEDLRDYLLLQLTSQFGAEGSATGETFNKTGKTDILIRYNTMNAFIAECKFWGGKERYFETITQLIEYLTWRDSKAAVIIFVKNKSFSEVLETIKNVTSEHPNFSGFISEQTKSWYNYRFHLSSSRNREIKLAVMLFHTPLIETK